MRRKTNTITLAIQPPQLPHAAAEQLPAAEMTDQAAYVQLALSNHAFAGHTADDVLFDRVGFKRVDLNQTHLTIPQMLDMRFEGCDLAGAEWQKAHLQRIELVGCRLTGTKLLEAELEHVLMEKCQCEFALFWSSTFKAVRFEGCSLRQASFEGADLSGVVFRNCDLRGVDLRDTTLSGTDFRSSVIDGMQIGLKELRGAIISPPQTIHLASLLGVIVKDEAAME